MKKYRVNPGKYKHFITFQKLENIQNEFGESANVWHDVANVKAAIYSTGGKEFYRAETVRGELTHKIETRYIPGIRHDMRIKFGERIFELVAPPINYQEQNRELQLLCKELF